MKRNNRGVSLQNDTRAVAPLVGFILLFGFLVIAFSGYQAQVVPQQNAETEFEHFEETRYELIELKNAIGTTGSSDRAQFPTVKLGTNYRTRTLALNGPPPSGLLQTSEPYPINISNEDGELVRQVQTRFIEYRPGYYELDIGSTWYEHSVLYLDDRDRRDGLYIIGEQDIVKEGNVTITALQNSFQETGTGRVTLEVYPMNDFSTGDLPEGDNLTVTIPTRLDAEDYWNEALEDAGDTYQGVDNETHGNDTHALNLSVDSDDLRVNTVGIQTEPKENPVTNIDRTASIRVEVFDEVGDQTWDVPDGVNEVDVLVVGGGGGGGINEGFSSAGAGGGGAGEVVYFEGYDVGSVNQIGVRVGEGGDGAISGSTPGENGTNSEFDEIIAVGGGGGAGGRPGGNQEVFGKDGGSGGGSRTEAGEIPGGDSISENVLPGAEYFGNPGGNALGGSGNDQGGSGGGGAGEPGFTNDEGDLFCDGRDGGDGGDGGDGVYFGGIFGEGFGEDGHFGGGGGGGAYDGCDDGSGGSGGIGGGGDGTLGDGSNIRATDGLNNTGGGGGGGASTGDAEGGDGGSGVVIIRWSP
jgi:hypothetical protein